MKREEAKARAKKSIDDIFTKIDELEKEADATKASQKAEYQGRVKELKEKKKDLQEKYDKVKNASSISIRCFSTEFQEQY